MRFLAILLGAFLVAGCSTSGGNPTAQNDGLVRDTTPGGVRFMAPTEVVAEPGWPDAMREIDVAVAGFESAFSGRRLAIDHIHFHGMDESSDDDRACFVGDGKIEACYHETEAHLFCVSEAIRDLAADQYPDAPVWQLDWAEQVSTSWVANLYGIGARLD